MLLTPVEQSLMLAAYFRGGLHSDPVWYSGSDQIVTLSLFYTGDISSTECVRRFSDRGYVRNVYDEEGELSEEIESRYGVLVKLVREHPELIEGGGNFETPAHPTFTACRLTEDGLDVAPGLLDSFPRKPEFPAWPNRRTMRDSE